MVDREKTLRVRGASTAREASHRPLDRARLWISHRALQAWWDMRRRGGRLWITRWSRQLCWRMRMRANDGVCSVEIANKYVGFFGQMNWCLFIFQYCERHQLFPDIRLTGDSYLDPTRGQIGWSIIFMYSHQLRRKKLPNGFATPRGFPILRKWARLSDQK